MSHIQANAKGDGFGSVSMRILHTMTIKADGHFRRKQKKTLIHCRGGDRFSHPFVLAEFVLSA